MLGRPIGRADDQPGCPPVAVISHAFWQTELGGSRDVLSTSLPMNGLAVRIIGVAEPSFFGIEFGERLPIWVPLCLDRPGILRRGLYTGRMGRQIVARMPAGATIAQMRSRMASLTPAILDATLPPNADAESIARHRQTTFRVEPFAKGIPSLRMGAGNALLLAMGVVGIVLLIACANVANLLLARATARRHEIAVRLALGASRWRLARQLLTESLLLALLGAAVGVLFAIWGDRLLIGLLPIVVSVDLMPDTTVLGFTIAIATLTGLLFGSVPAWRAVRVDSQAVLKPAHNIASGHSRFSAGKALVAAQIALSLALVAGAGLLLGSWQRLATIDPGFERDHALIVDAALPPNLPRDQQGATYERILDQLDAVPGVSAVSAASRTPFSPSNWIASIDVPGFTPSSERESSVQLNMVTGGYFASIGAGLVAGRDFEPSDAATSPRVAIVNEELAQRFFGGRAALGKSLGVWLPDGLRTPIEIVGIARNTKQASLREDGLPIAYLALSQETQPGPSTTFVLRATGSPAAIVAATKVAIARVDPRITLTVKTLAQQVDTSILLPRALGLLAGFFGALALVLASIGLYGLISYSVEQRRTEIGVRIALGAGRQHIIRMVLADVGRLLGVGVAIGGALTLSGTRLVKTFLYGVAPNDPATLVLAVITHIGVAVGAAVLPARRASRLDPMEALRRE
jgi:putative ABC transport system permease protein